MPKIRVNLPIEAEITPETSDTLKAAGDVARRVRDSGLVDAVGRLVGAAKRLRRRPPARSR
jgi:hypothetical protein